MGVFTPFSIKPAARLCSMMVARLTQRKYGECEMKHLLVVCALLTATSANAASIGGGKHGNHSGAGFGPAGGQAAAGQAAHASTGAASNAGTAGQSGNGGVVVGECDFAHYSICGK